MKYALIILSTIFFHIFFTIGNNIIPGHNKHSQWKYGNNTPYKTYVEELKAVAYKGKDIYFFRKKYESKIYLFKKEAETVEKKSYTPHICATF